MGRLLLCATSVTNRYQFRETERLTMTDPDDNAAANRLDNGDHTHDHPHDDDQPHAHPHVGKHDHPHPHDHAHDHGRFGWLLDAIPFLHGHSHSSESKIDAALESSERGIWALKVSLLGLGATALFQVVIVLISGSVGLLADTIHNFADAFTAVPLWIAFALSRRAANRRYTYGYGRAEDIAGVIIVLTIFVSALVAGYESYQKIVQPQPLSNVWWVIAA